MNKKGFVSILGLIITVAIIMYLVYLAAKSYTGNGSSSGTSIKSSMQKTRETLNQLKERRELQ